MRHVTKRAFIVAAMMSVALPPSIAFAQTQPKPATEATKAANRAMEQRLNWKDRADFENAARAASSPNRTRSPSRT